MPTRDPRVDAYIAKAADFAKPILVHLRAIIHTTCPDVVEEIKWGVPHFSYHGMLCGMAAFKEHLRFGFWHRGMAIPSAEGDRTGMVQFGHVRTITDLPSKKILVGYIQEAMRLNVEGVKPQKPPRAPKAPLKVPTALKAALSRNRRAQQTFEAFPPSHKREYVEWITEAKTIETRDRRIAQAIAWMAEGKSRNWKYQTTR